MSNQRFCWKGNNEEYKVNKKENEHDCKSVYECEKEHDAIEKDNKLMIGALINKKLRVIDKNYNFIDRQ